MWTLTFKECHPDSWCGNMHQRLVRALGDDAKRHPSAFPNGFGGVRVVEDHPGGHGLHYHWIVRGRLPLHRVRERAIASGFGHVFIARDENRRFRKVDEGAAGYVAKYLTKGSRLVGVRTWANIGDYEGVKTRDIEFDSTSNRVFRQAYRTAKLAGANPQLCYSEAVIKQRAWEMDRDIRSEGIASGS